MRTLTMVYISLLFFLFLSVAIRFLPFGGWSSLISMLIAVVKAGLIFFFFMKMRESSPSLRLVAIVGIFWLVFLFGMTGTDYLTRGMTGVLGK